MAAAFILIGSLCKQFTECLEKQESRWSHIPLLFLGLLGVYVSKQMNPQSVLMYINQYGDYLWFFVGAISGIVATLLIGRYLFKLLNKGKGVIYSLLMWLGFNSLVLFPVHLQIKVYFGGILRYIGISHWFVLWALFLIVGIPISNIITNYLPWVLGHKLKLRTNIYVTS